MVQPVQQTDIPEARLLSRGKVRDIYDAGEYLLIVTTDRISAFDVVMNEPIPYKGIVLTQISRFWFEKTRHIVENHFVTDRVADFPEPFNRYGELLKGRAMLVKKANPFPVECIVRGYLAGSGWKEYRQSGTVHGMALPEGLVNSSQLPEPLFTPSTKAETGHDENISYQRMVEIVGEEHAQVLKEKSLALYQYGAEVARLKGIIIADTKFEFGMIDGQILLIDEAMTPDSSRFWPAELYQPGQSQPSLDKQYLRDYLETLDWDKTPPPPPLPEEVVANTSRKYQEILKILTGRTVEEILNSD
jgi:phosphoribosylaminoimidazole-succinocarboxamide synthase